MIWRPRFWSMALFLLSLAAVAVLFSLQEGGKRHQALVLGLLIPDDANRHDPRLTAWLDAATEEGLPMEAVTASALLRPIGFGNKTFAGLVLPDSIHRAMSDVLIERLGAYVRRGGKLMVVFDAGTFTLPGKTYAPQKSRLSSLVGIDYALYDRLKDTTTQSSEVFGLQKTLLMLQVPPGKFYSPAGNPEGDHKVSDGPLTHEEANLFTYEYDVMQYPHFMTHGPYAGDTMLDTNDNTLIAGVHSYGEGRVLFVNLPLGFLKTRTDGLLLHGFLRYFGATLVQLPYLSTAPNGVGGLVMNWHVDSNAAPPALRQLKQTKLFEQGPYSVHVTAGPDLSRVDDGLGLNVPGNAEVQEWLRFFAQRQDAVGTHGGWIHDYFGAHVTETNRHEFEPFLWYNKEAIEGIINRPVTEYSAPLGTHPVWVTEWLEAQNVLAYYFTGDMGMGPTKPYRHDQRSFQRAWAFPVLNMGKYAAFEEMHADGVPEQEVAQWLKAITDFTANNHVIRLVYFHPPGVLRYLGAMDEWLERAQKRRSQGVFSWYTMTDVASFLSAREQVRWRVSQPSPHEVLVEAAHPVSLVRQNWRLPATRYGKPIVVHGMADVLQDGNEWLVRAQGDTTLMFKVPLQLPQ